MNERGLTKNEVIRELARSPHGKYEEYIPMGVRAANEEPEFFAHLISWNRQKGSIRDAKVALPLVSLMAKRFTEPEFVENSLAHLATLGPRELLKAYRFMDTNRVLGHMTAVRKLVRGYLLRKERNWAKWEREMLVHRSTLRELYAIVRKHPFDDRTRACLWRKDREGRRMPYPFGGLFELVANLQHMGPVEAAGAILSNHLPFIAVEGALGKNRDNPDLVLALIGRMTATELVTHTKALERMGIKTNPVLRGAFAEALRKAQSDTKNVLKTTAAVEEIEDEGLKVQMQDLQEKRIAKLAAEGDWLVLADKSQSMANAIEASRHISATLAKFVKGHVSLIFFDSAPRMYDVSGKSLDEIKEQTRHVTASGNTSIGCGLKYAHQRKLPVDGIAIVSDGGDNTVPYFYQVYDVYCKTEKEVPVYFYKLPGDPDSLSQSMRQTDKELQTFDLTGEVDYYSLPNLVQTMRTNQYSLVDEVMECKLLKLADVYRTVEIAAAV